MENYFPNDSEINRPVPTPNITPDTVLNTDQSDLNTTQTVLNNDPMIVEDDGAPARGEHNPLNPNQTNPFFGRITQPN